MNQTTESILQEEGILFPTGELNRNKLNLMSGSTIPQFCDMFWEASLGDKELLTTLCSIMQTMYEEGRHKEMLDVLYLLYGLVGLELQDEIKPLRDHQEAMSYFLREMLLDFDDVFTELVGISVDVIEK
jgi:hypothetical protein